MTQRFTKERLSSGQWSVGVWTPKLKAMPDVPRCLSAAGAGCCRADRCQAVGAGFGCAGAGICEAPCHPGGVQGVPPNIEWRTPSCGAVWHLCTGKDAGTRLAEDGPTTSALRDRHGCLSGVCEAPSKSMLQTSASRVPLRTIVTDQRKMIVPYLVCQLSSCGRWGTTKVPLCRFGGERGAISKAWTERSTPVVVANVQSLTAKWRQELEWFGPPKRNTLRPLCESGLSSLLGWPKVAQDYKDQEMVSNG